MINRKDTKIVFGYKCPSCNHHYVFVRIVFLPCCTTACEKCGERCGLSPCNDCKV